MHASTLTLPTRSGGVRSGRGGDTMNEVASLLQEVCLSFGFGIVGWG